AAPPDPGAQPAPKVPRLAYLGGATPEDARSPDLQGIWDALDRSLRDHGYVEGQNLVIDRPVRRGKDGPISRSRERVGSPESRRHPRRASPRDHRGEGAH